MHALPEGPEYYVLCMAEHSSVNNSKRNNPVAQVRLKLTKLQQGVSSSFENHSTANWHRYFQRQFHDSRMEFHTACPNMLDFGNNWLLHCNQEIVSFRHILKMCKRNASILNSAATVCWYVCYTHFSQVIMSDKNNWPTYNSTNTCTSHLEAVKSAWRHLEQVYSWIPFFNSL